MTRGTAPGARWAASQRLDEASFACHRGILVGEQQELIAAAPVSARHDHRGATRIAEMDRVALVMRVVNRVHDDPRLLEARADHRDAQLLARAAAASVTADDELRHHRMLPPAGVRSVASTPILGRGDTDQLGLEADLDTGEALGASE